MREKPRHSCRGGCQLLEIVNMTGTALLMALAAAVDLQTPAQAVISI